MCSEAVWWRCHRSIISDHLKEQGWIVMHIMKEALAKEHPYATAFWKRILGMSPICNISVYNLLMNFKSGDL